MFKRVMESLGVEVIAHMPAGSDGRRNKARAKGKVERPFRTVKDAHETLYHFHQPASEEGANRWLARASFGSDPADSGLRRIIEREIHRPNPADGDNRRLGMAAYDTVIVRRPSNPANETAG